MKQTIKDYFFAIIAEMSMVTLQIINIFFISRNLGGDGSAAYEVIMPVTTIAAGLMCLFYTGLQAVCAKDYGKGDSEAFRRHKNAGYTWLIIVMSVLTVILALVKDPFLDALGANEGNDLLFRYCEDTYVAFLPCYILMGLFVVACSLLFFEEKKHILISTGLFYAFMLTGNIIVSQVSPNITAYILINSLASGAADVYLFGIYFLRNKKKAIARFDEFHIRFSDLKETLFAGFPEFMEYIFASLTYIIVNLYVLERFSQSLVAGISIFEGIDNIPEVICVGFELLATATLGVSAGRMIAASKPEEQLKAQKEHDASIKKTTKCAVLIGLAFGALLILVARPLVNVFLTETEDAAAMESAVLLTRACAVGFVFYLLNTELVCYYKIVRAFTMSHVLYFAESLFFPVAFKILLGELFGVTGFCFGAMTGEIFAFLLNLCFVWAVNKRFPIRLADFRLDSYIAKLRDRK